MKILCVGDLHVGRRSSAVPRNEERYSCAHAWLRAVDVALEEKVEVALLSGDLIDADNKFFEAAGPLEAGLRKLTDQKVHVFAVAGNHDFEALPQFIQPMAGEYLHLLGLGGNWESQTIDCGGQKLRVAGWSFPTQHVSSNPLDSWDIENNNVPTVGLLHCDLDSADGSYAPVSLADLKSRNEVCFWLVGHIHIPNSFPGGGPLVLNPGSLQAMHPNEQGDHGPWIVEINGKTLSEPRQIKNSTIKYCGMKIDVSEFENDNIRGEVIGEISRQAARLAKPGDVASHSGQTISARVKITGTTSQHDKLPGLLKGIEETSHGEVYVESITFDTSPPIDLEPLAEGRSATAVAAKILLSIQKNTLAQDHPELLQDTLDELNRVYSKATGYDTITVGNSGNPEDSPPSKQAAIDILRVQCTALLNEMTRGA